MRKSFCTDDHQELIEAAGGRISTFFERGDKMTKSASEAISKQDIQDHMPPDDHFGIHLISMGSEESFGSNRNGDAASERSLKTYHPTFEKFGCVFREHKNKNPVTQGVGSVKLARYNDKMSRGELIVWVDKEKAPDMYKAAKEGKESSFSMSMRLPFDRCSCCDKRSRNVSDYCDHLKNNMLQFIPGFQKYAYARNEDDVKFFDLSEVKRRADRIATYLGYFGDKDIMAKAAAEAGDEVITGAEWAAHLYGVDRVVPFTPWETLTLEKLAAAESFVKHASHEVLDTLKKMAPQNITKEHVELLANPDFRNVAGELAKRAMFLSFPSFASIITGKPIDELEKEADFQDVLGVKLPSLFSDLFRQGGASCGDEVVESVTPDECGCSFTSDKDSIDRLLTEVGDDLGMDKGSTSGRALKVTIVKSASLMEKRASDKELSPFYEAMSEAYGAYLVKSAHIAKDLPNVSSNELLRTLTASLMIR